MKSLLLFFFYFSLSFATFAQSESVGAIGSKNWGIETDLVMPFIPEVHIYTLRLSRTVFSATDSDLKGDVLFGVYIRPHIEHDIVYKIDEYLLTLGYRQYFWKGLHLEGQIGLGQAWGTNRIDKKYYDKFTILGEVNAGYKFNITSNSVYTLFIAPQMGVLHGIKTDIGPRGGKSDTFFTGKFNIGIAF